MTPSADVPRPRFPAAKFTVMANGTLPRSSSMNTTSTNAATLNAGSYGVFLVLGVISCLL